MALRPHRDGSRGDGTAFAATTLPAGWRYTTRLPHRSCTVRTGQRGRDTLDLLQVLTDDHVFRLYLGHAAVNTGGQALELGVRAAATVGIQVTLERSTDVSQGLRHA